MNLGLEDKLILVTGGSSGIGAAITRACLAEGASVAVLGREDAAVREFFADPDLPRDRCRLYAGELDGSDRSRGLVAEVERDFHRIDGLVNNAGTNDGVGLEHGNVSTFVQSLQTNLVQCYALTQAALPALRQSRGSIVNISSKVALTGQGGTSGYAAAKGALLALTREWAAELLPAGIRVNAVVPAEVMTPQYTWWLQRVENPKQQLDAITGRIPLGHRMTTPQEIAATVAFLLSPLQSAHTTGQQLVVDGGYVHLDRALT